MVIVHSYVSLPEGTFHGFVTRNFHALMCFLLTIPMGYADPISVDVWTVCFGTPGKPWDSWRYSIDTYIYINIGRETIYIYHKYTYNISYPFIIHISYNIYIYINMSYPIYILYIHTSYFIYDPYSPGLMRRCSEGALSVETPWKRRGNRGDFEINDWLMVVNDG